MVRKIKKQFGRVTLFVLSVLVVSTFLYSCEKKNDDDSSNQPPTAKAGPDISIAPPTTSVTIDGSGSNDPDGTVRSYSWTKTNGGTCILGGTTAPTLTVTALATGAYVFKLTVADMFGATGSDEVTVTVGDNNKTAIATIGQVNMDTVISGTGTFKQKNNEDVTLTLDITCLKMANKSVAVHLHLKPDCSMNASMAMGHWNPTNAPHGQWGVGSFHLGDIGNIPLDASGHGTKILTTNLWNINGADTSRNVVGRSIIVHSGVDTYSIQPTGNSGSRIGCGAIK